MAQLSHVIEIHRKPQEVFELLGDPTRAAEWAGPVVAVEALMPGTHWRRQPLSANVANARHPLPDAP